jgi:glycosyltransferase involved in cell wall biosynthesis
MLSLAFLPNRRSSNLIEEGPTFVVAPLSEASGIGAGARLHISQGMAGRRQVRPVDMTPLFRKPDSSQCAFPTISIKEARSVLGPGTVVIHANPPHCLIVLLSLGRKFLRHKKIVAYWVWELDDIPSLWQFALRFVDCIEVPSRFVAAAVARHTSKPIAVIPHPVPKAVGHRRQFAEDGVTRVLFMFDMAGRISRKNPMAAIQAFKQAFGGRGNAIFTIKVSPSPGFEDELTQFAELVSGEPSVVLLVTRLSPDEVDGLYASHDIYLSLHRAEGYGLTIREAIEHGLHVVATGWSGNMDFMHGQRVHPVGCRLVAVTEDQDVFSVPDAKWAEPDIEQAAQVLSHIDRSERVRLQARRA